MEGLLVTIKDADELYVSGGTIEINGTTYEAESQLTVSLSGVSANTLYYLYVNAPASGVALTATEITVSATDPTFDHARGAYYMTADTTKRLLAKYWQAGGNVSKTISATADDGKWRNGTSLFATTEASDYFGNYIGDHLHSFFRFRNLPFVAGDTVSSVFVTFTARESLSGTTCNVNCYFNAADDAAAPTTGSEAKALALTTAVAWNNVAAMTANSTYATPDLSVALQEVIDRPGWAYGNDVMLVVKDNGSSYGAYRGVYDLSGGGTTTLSAVVNTIGVSKVIDDRRVGIGMDSDNVLNDEEALLYDTLIGGVKGVTTTGTGSVVRATSPALTTPTVDHIEESTSDHGVCADGVTLKDGGALIITGGANTFNITNGTASLDVAEAKTVNIDDDVTVAAELHVEAATHVNQDLTTDAAPTFAGETLTGQVTLSGSGVTYFKERPRIELSRILGASKPSIVYRGIIRGFSLPIYNSDNEEIFLDLPNVPARWDGASDPIVYVQGYLDTANTSKKFKLACDWTYFSAGDEPDGVAVESPSVETTTATWGQYHTFTAAITLNYDVVADNALAVGDFLQLRVYRIAASGDEIDGEVVVTGVAIRWKMDKLYSSS